ncbi:hypothetical protein BKA70DRAFT_1219144 [Coprinopsis sp. MPI-PUGE-AT-0042]|nr:hypothetical protein BKA70DRAFT_1219144 [Coprinopsis sp. MPI-PUGE-AT-0042]
MPIASAARFCFADSVPELAQTPWLRSSGHLTLNAIRRVVSQRTTRQAFHFHKSLGSNEYDMAVDQPSPSFGQATSQGSRMCLSANEASEADSEITALDNGKLLNRHRRHRNDGTVHTSFSQEGASRTMRQGNHDATYAAEDLIAVQRQKIQKLEDRNTTAIVPFKSSVRYADPSFGRRELLNIPSSFVSSILRVDPLFAFLVVGGSVQVSAQARNLPLHTPELGKIRNRSAESTCYFDPSSLRGMEAALVLNRLSNETYEGDKLDQKSRIGSGGNSPLEKFIRAGRCGAGYKMTIRATGLLRNYSSFTLAQASLCSRIGSLPGEEIAAPEATLVRYNSGQGFAAVAQTLRALLRAFAVNSPVCETDVPIMVVSQLQQAPVAVWVHIECFPSDVPV